MKIVFDEKYGAEKRQYVDWYLPESENFDLLIWFHGGGLESGSRKDISFARDLVKNNTACVLLNTRCISTHNVLVFINE